MLPADAAALLRKKCPHAASEARAVASNAKPLLAPPSNVALLGQSEAGGPLVPQTELRTSTHVWHPCTFGDGNDAEHVVFIGQPLSNGEQFPFQLHASKSETTAEKSQRRADFDKKQAQLRSALASNKRAYEDAKENGEVMEVGALAIERDRIKQELAVPFVPAALSSTAVELWIAPLSVKLPFGYFKHQRSIVAVSSVHFLFSIRSRREPTSAVASQHSNRRCRTAAAPPCRNLSSPHLEISARFSSSSSSLHRVR